MGRGNNKFSSLNLNDIYGKKEPKPKPAAPTTNGNSGGNQLSGYMLVLSRQKEPSLVAKHEEDKTISTPSQLKKESLDNPWAISKEGHQNEEAAEDAHANNTKSKSETFSSSKPDFQSNDLVTPRSGAAKIEGESRGIPARRPSPVREIGNWDDDERSSTLPLHQQKGGMYFGDGRKSNMNNHYSSGNRHLNLGRDYPVQGDSGDKENDSGRGGQRWERRYGYGMK